MSKLRNFVKYFFETAYWSVRCLREGKLSNTHYEYLYTSPFGFEKTFYSGKRILDIGCGPRGSLEWADNAGERVGLDPLVPVYKKMGISKHSMKYVSAVSENIPFSDGYFDVVCSINSLDHVQDLEQTIKEIIRVLAVNGTFLLLTDVHQEATLCEPAAFSWNVVDMFSPKLELLECEHREKAFSGMGKCLRDAPPFDHKDQRERHGILSAKFRKLVD